MLSTTEWTVLIAVLALIGIVAMALFMIGATRRRHAELKHRFGPEYEREVHQRGSVMRAERELLAREKRVRKHQLQPLSEAERARFSEDWHHVQARFVDHPSSAVEAADELIQTVMRVQGYDVESFDQRVADLSVEHAGSVQHYRAAHDLAEANREGRADTEALRQAMVYYRALFADLLQPPMPESRLEESPAQAQGRHELLPH